jgi:hypothetical protein
MVCIHFFVNFERDLRVSQSLRMTKSATNATIMKHTNATNLRGFSHTTGTSYRPIVLMHL